MTSFFISHSSQDGAASARVRERLQTGGYESVFLDFDPEDGIPAGRNWERELYAQLRRSDAVIFLCSAASVASTWCFAELALARATGKPIFPIALETAVRHPLLEDSQSVEWIELGADSDGDVAFERLRNGFRSYGFDPLDTFAWDPNRAPFPGLLPLESEDAAVFFGREAEIEELLARLQPILVQSRRFIAVVGPSGSGKSSLVRAGLVPRLQRLGARWTVVPPLRPGRRPLSVLARTLAAELGESDWRRLRERIERDPVELVALLEDLLDETEADGGSVLLVLDQAEELVTADPDERAAVLAALGAALQESSPFWVVATLRSESVTAVLQQPAIVDVIGPAVMLGTLDRTRIPEVIELPARAAGVELEPGLVGRMVEETRGGDALPLLAYTLRQLYERLGPDRRLTMKDYDAIGGVLGALRGRADAIVEELERSGRGDLVIPTLLKFVRVEPQGEPIGRRVLRQEISADEDEVVQAFVEARLLTSDGAGEEVVVGVAHDSLLRSWAPLRQAIDASRADLQLRSELEHLAREWDSVGRPDSYLLREERLAGASSFLESKLGRAEMPLVQEFVERSLSQSKAVLRRESDLLAGRVLEILDEDPERGLLLALAAVEEYSPSPRAIRALNAAVAASRVRLRLFHEDLVMSAAFSPDGSRIVTSSSDGTARVWDSVSGEELGVLHHGSTFLVAVLSPDGRRVVTASAEGDETARVWDAASGNELLGLSGHEGVVLSVSFSPDGRRIVTASEDGTARLWDAARAEELYALRSHESVVWSAAFSPDGARVATASHDGTARIWDAASGAELQVLRGHEKALGIAVFSSDGDRVVTAAQDQTARVWDAVSGEELHVLRHEARIWSVVCSPDGNRIVTAADDKAARVWDAASGEELHVLRHDDKVVSAAFSADGSRIVTASGFAARVWDATGGEELLALHGHAWAVFDVAFSPDGSRVVTASGDGTALVWDATVGEELHVLQHDHSVLDAAFSPDGGRVVTASQDETARVWDAASGQELCVLHHEDGVSCAAFSADADRVITGSHDRTARVWDAASGKELRVLRHESGVGSVVFSSDATRVVTSSFKTARVWDAASGEELHALGHESFVWGASFSQDGSRVLTRADDKIARVWDLRAGMQLHVLPHASSAVFSADGSRVLTGTDDGTVRVWDAANGEELQVLRGHDGSVWGAVFSADGSRVVTASDDRTARVWDAAGGEELQILRGHEFAVRSAAFSPDGSRVVTASDDGTARVWDTEEGELVQILRGHRDGLWSAEFSPDGCQVLTRSYDATARVWEVLPLDALIARGKAQVVRELTDAERAEYGLVQQAHS